MKRNKLNYLFALLCALLASSSLTAQIVDVGDDPKVPTAFAVSGDVQTCMAGTSDVVLMGSEVGVTYYLQKNGNDSIMPSGQKFKVNGTGYAIVIGNFGIGKYTLRGQNGVGATMMTGDANIVGVGTSTSTVSIAMSEADRAAAFGTVITITATPVDGGVNPVYNWYVNSVLQSSVSGAVFSYTKNASDIVQVKMIPNAFCPNLAESNVLNISNPITPYTVSGTTTIAAGGTASVTLSDSETGVTYTLWKNGVLTSVTPISGTNAAISFTGLGEGTYTIKGENSLGVTQMLGNAIISLATKQLTLKVYLEGLWNGTNMNKCKKWDDALGDVVDAFATDIVDTISIELRNKTTYATIDYQLHGLELHQNGTVTSAGKAYVEVPAAAADDYYLTIRTRNHLETTSASTVSFSAPTVAYDFTDSHSKAYVFSEATFTSQKPKDGKWMIYVGNILQEVDYPQVSFLDMMQVFENYSDTKGVYGYLREDLNGDGFADFMDLLMCFGNSADGIYFYKE